MPGYIQKEKEGDFTGYIEQGTNDTVMGRKAYLAR